jgi:hypothetical protein
MKEINDLKEVKEVTVEDNVKEKEGLFATDADYDSGWHYDTSHNHTLEFDHKIGYIPGNLVVLFTVDKETVYPITWSWLPDHSGNPVTISMDNKRIRLAIYKGVPLHGVCEIPGPWKFYRSGYWRIFAWK